MLGECDNSAIRGIDIDTPRGPKREYLRTHARSEHAAGLPRRQQGYGMRGVGTKTMPIRHEERGRYPPDWKAISLRVREEAKWQCEWCGAKDKRIQPESRTWDDCVGDVDVPNKVVLTVAHLNHRPEDNRRENLRALCRNATTVTTLQ